MSVFQTIIDTLFIYSTMPLYKYPLHGHPWSHSSKIESWLDVNPLKLLLNMSVAISQNELSCGPDLSYKTFKNGRYFQDNDQNLSAFMK